MRRPSLSLRKREKGQYWIANAPICVHISFWLECALFPDLYPFTSWCDTFVLVSSRHSVKESLCAKMSSAFIDHAADHRLHQFHFDRWQWSTVTAVYNVSVTNKMTLSFTLSEKWFSPEYIFNVASAVTGIVRKLGPPTWFWTFAPAEWTCPLHMVVEDRMTQGNAVDAFAVGSVVAANVAHGMSELIKGSITGKNYQKPWKWKNSLLSNVRTFVVRPELQKGTSRD